MKRLLPVLLMFLLLLSACGPKTVGLSPDNPVTLTLWHYYNGTNKDTFDALVQTFNETIGKEKGILVDAHAYSGVNELSDAVFASANKEVGSSPLPDIFAAYSDNVYRLHQLSLVASLDAYFSKEELSLYREDFLSEGRFDKDGALRMIPIAKSTEILYLNATDFDAFTAATGIGSDDMATWEGIARTAERYYAWTDAQTPAEGDGQPLFGIDSMANFILISCKQLGEEFYTPSETGATFNLSKETAKRIWDAIYVPYVSGHYASIGRFRSDDTKSGDLLAYVGSSASASYFPKQVETGKDNAYPITCHAMPYPYYEGGSKVAVQQGAGMAVTKSDTLRETAAVTFLKWFTAPEQNIDFAITTGYMPVQNASLDPNTILEEIRKQPDIHEDSPVMQTANVIYPALSDYALYASKPFAQSYDARKVLEKHLTDYINRDKETLSARMAQGETRAAVLHDLTAEQNFEQWYNAFISEMTKQTKE